MALWLILAAMTAAAVLAVLWPLRRPAEAVPSGADVAVYRDQLDEIERDAVAGLIGKAEAEAARLEVSRRLLTAGRMAENAVHIADRKPALSLRYVMTTASLVILLFGAGSLYLFVGSPSIPSAPIASRLDTLAEHRSIERMVAQVEAYLGANSEDGRGWEVLAPIYMRYGRYENAVNAWRNVLRLLGETAERQANLGEALVAAANDIVTSEAEKVFKRAIALDAEIASANFYLGLAAEQAGRADEATTMWRNLLARAPADAHWLGSVREALARVEGRPSEKKPIATVVPGPRIEDMEAAAKLAPEQQSAMIRGMVDRLAERLKTDGSDLEGWIRLVRAYQVLGETEKVLAAVADARRALAGNSDKMRQLDQTLRGLGVNG